MSHDSKDARPIDAQHLYDLAERALDPLDYDRQDHEDLRQVAVLAMLDLQRQYERCTDALLVRGARNACIDLQRHEHQQPRAITQPQHDDMQRQRAGHLSNAEWDRKVARGEIRPNESEQHKEMRRRAQMAETGLYPPSRRLSSSLLDGGGVERLLGLATPRQAKALRLHHLAGLRWSDVALRMGISKSGAASLGRRGLARIRAALARGDACSGAVRGDGDARQGLRVASTPGRSPDASGCV